MPIKMHYSKKQLAEQSDEKKLKKMKVYIILGLIAVTVALITAYWDIPMFII